LFLNIAVKNVRHPPPPKAGDIFLSQNLS
jgi:hypothetical protein